MNTLKNQKKEFATLIRGMLEFERLDAGDTEIQRVQFMKKLEEVRRERFEIEGAIRKVEKYYGLFHTSHSELGKLQDIPLPPSIPDIITLDRYKTNRAFMEKVLQKGTPSFLAKLKSSALLGKMQDVFGIREPIAPSQFLRMVSKTTHYVRASQAEKMLATQRKIRDLWLQQSDLVVREFKLSGEVFDKWRRHRIASLVYRDHDNSARLREYANALDSQVTNQRKARRVSKVLEGTDISLLLECFPIWAGTSAHLSQALKLQSALFDYVIIDEASLCDPASAIPALYRGKNLVVVGDEKQLKHRSQISEAKHAALISQNKLDDAEVETFSITKSMYQISADRSPKSGKFMLDEHFRSLPPIIAYSNKAFYESRLKLMRRTPSNEHAEVVVFKHVPGKRNDSDVIPEEYESALEIVYEILTSQSPESVGVVTMTEAQAKYMLARFREDLQFSDIEALNFKCGTPQAFQGDQRHTIILCLGLDREVNQRAFAHALDDNRFNVAVTRAEDKMYIISSIPHNEFIGRIGEYYSEVNGFNGGIKTAEDRHLCESKFEEEVYDTLKSKGWNVIPQYESCGYRIDFVVTRGQAFIGIEVDGPHHFDDSGAYVQRDVERTMRLNRAKWIIERISCYEWERGLDARRAFVDRVEMALAERSC